jgi:hypothetical protein
MTSLSLRRDNPMANSRNDTLFCKKVLSVADKINTNSLSLYDLRVLLYISFIDRDKWPICRETPKPGKLGKIAQKLSIPEKEFSQSLQLFQDSKENNLTPVVIKEKITLNSDKVKEICDIWKENTGIPLGMAEKVDISDLLRVFDHVPLILIRWFRYQEEFKALTQAERRKWYLFGNKFHNFKNNIQRFATDKAYQETLEEHLARMNNQVNVPLYGFSTNAAEDKLLALENERSMISLALQIGEEYKKAILFPENIAWYERKKKKMPCVQKGGRNG